MQINPMVSLIGALCVVSLAHSTIPGQEFQVDGSTVALWHFDEGQGDSTYDASGNGNHGQIVGATWTTGKFGTCLQYNGSSMVVVADKPSLHLQTMTVEAWVYSTDFTKPSQGVFVTKDYSGPTLGSYRLQLYSSGGYITFITGQDWSAYALSSIALQNSQWHLVAGVWSRDTLRIYIDGVFAGKQAKTGTIPYDATTLLIGACHEASRADFIGLIDEVRISNIDRYASLVPVLIPCSPNPTYNPRPSFAWHRSDSISVYRLELSQDPSFSNPLASLPTTDTLYNPTVDLPTGTIYWHVGNDGDQRAWSPIATVFVQDSTVPLLIPYAPDPTVERKPVLRWHSVRNGSPYTIQVDNYSDFSTTLVTVPASDTTYKPTVDLPIGPIYWRVKSALSGYSIVDMFMIQNDSIPILINMPDTVYSNEPQFKWHPGVGAAAYRIQIDTLGSFANPFAVIPVTDTTYTPGYSLPYARIFWRVSSDVNLNRYSSVDTFRIMHPTASSRLVRSAEKHPILSLDSRGKGQMTLSFEVPTQCAAQVDLYRLTGEHVARLFTSREASGDCQVRLSSGWQWNEASSSNYLLVLSYGTSRISRVVSVAR